MLWLNFLRRTFYECINLESPYKLEYPEAWMAQELVEEMLAKTQGMVLCALPLNS